MAKEQKFYAVKKGRKTGIFHSWSECSDAVQGFSGAQYKSFLSEAEALAYLNDENKTKVPLKSKNTAIAYVDGSFNETTGEYGSGVVVFFDNNIHELSQKGNSPELAEMRNVGGEIIGAVMAIKKAVSLGAKNIAIYYDYAGIEEWAVGNWKANKTGTKKYKAFIDSARPKINISFEKVKAHTGNTYNERADILAKNAVGLSSTIVVTDSSKLNFSEKAKQTITKYPDLVNIANEFILKNNYYEEFDIIDMFFDEYLEKFNKKDMANIIEVIETLYKNNVDKGNIKIF